jgi:hypothetical protein
LEDLYKHKLKDFYKQYGKDSNQCIFDEYDRFISTIDTNIIDNNITPVNDVLEPKKILTTESNDVLELIQIMTPFIKIMYASQFENSRIYKSAKAINNQLFPKKCDESNYEEISKSLAQFLHAVVYYEYFEKLSPELIKGLKVDQNIFEKIEKLSYNKSVDVLTKEIAYKLNSTQCEKTDAFIKALRTKASQSTSLTKENISNNFNKDNSAKSTSDNSTKSTSDNTTKESFKDDEYLYDVKRITLTQSDNSASEINRISIEQDAVNRISYTEPIIKYIDSVTASIVPFDLQGGKLQTRRKNPSKTLRKKTLRKKQHKKTRRN